MPQGTDGLGIGLLWVCFECQKGADNGAADALSQVPVHHNCKMFHSLMEGAIGGTVDQSEVDANEEHVVWACAFGE